MSGREDYVTVVAIVKARTDKAVLLALGNDVMRGDWVPRSTLHFNSDRAVDDCYIGDELTIQVMEWVAEEKGLI